jgi:predicted PurR-regulated permease PerM
MTQEVINIIKELGFPIAVSLGLAYVLYKVVMWLLKDVVNATLNKFEGRHDHLLDEINEMKDYMQNRFDAERDDIEKVKKWLAEIKSDLKVYVDLTMKGK